MGTGVSKLFKFGFLGERGLLLWGEGGLEPPHIRLFPYTILKIFNINRQDMDLLLIYILKCT